MRELEYCQYGNQTDPDSVIILLPGRGQLAYDIVESYSKMVLDQSLLIGITSIDRQWYPVPKGPNNQDEAIDGIDESINALEEILQEVGEATNVSRKKTALVGHSSGGVMAIQLAAYSKKPFGCVVCHNGAILDPKSLPQCNHPNMPILLIHRADDDVFKWEERYVPMKETLKNNKYKILSREFKKGGHTLYAADIILASRFMANNLGYEI